MPAHNSIRNLREMSLEALCDEYIRLCATEMWLRGDGTEDVNIVDLNAVINSAVEVDDEINTRRGCANTVSAGSHTAGDTVFERFLGQTTNTWLICTRNYYRALERSYEGVSSDYYLARLVKMRRRRSLCEMHIKHRVRDLMQQSTNMARRPPGTSTLRSSLSEILARYTSNLPPPPENPCSEVILDMDALRYTADRIAEVQNETRDDEELMADDSLSQTLTKNRNKFWWMLRYYIKNHKMLDKKPNAYFWRWFYACIVAYRRSKGNQTFSGGIRAMDKINGLLTKNGLSELVLTMDDVYYPKSVVVPVIIDYDYVGWKHKSWLADQQESGYEWWFDPHSEAWVRPGNDVQCADTGLVFNLNVKTADKFFQCPHCNKWYESVEKKDSRYDPGQIICIHCYNQEKTPTNKPHTFETVYGGYHSHHSYWRFIPRTMPKENFENELMMGIEIEMHPKCGSRNAQTALAWSIYQDQQAINPDWNEFYCERDGSLAEGGLEMVTNPMSLAFHKMYWEKMLPVLNKYCLGWNLAKHGISAQNYGIHITFDRRHLSDYQLARMLKFHHEGKNHKFVVPIAQRRLIYGSSMPLAAQDKPHLTQLCLMQREPVKVLGQKGKLKIAASERNQPIHVKSTGTGRGLIEVRMFASTLNPESFMKNIEYIHALHEWIRETSYSVDYTDFLKWLGSDKKRRAKYPNLLSYLSRKKFGVKNAGGLAYLNEWATLLMNSKKEQLELFDVPATIDEEQ